MSENIREEVDTLVLRYIENPRPELKDMIMVQYAGLVERIARRFSGLESHDDLVQVGYVGLLNALTKYDPSAGVRFNTYSTHLIAGEIKHYLRDRSQTIRQPAWLQELRHKVNKSNGLLQAKLGRVPTVAELAEETGVTAHAIEEVFQTQEMLKLTSLDQGVTDDESGEVDNLDSAQFCKEQLSVEDRVVLESAMKQLRDIERDVLVLFHFETLNQTEIASRLGISCNYVSHILRQSLGKLRRILTAETQKDFKLRQEIGQDENTVCPTTGVYNEEYFYTRLQEELHRAASHNGLMGLIRVDFKGLEALRGYYGQGSVDDLLADASDFLKEAVRRIDVVCRVGDHGFGIILCATQLSADIVCHRLTQLFNDWLKSRRAPLGPIKLCLGSATYPDHATGAKALFELAEPTEVQFSGEAAA